MAVIANLLPIKIVWLEAESFTLPAVGFVSEPELPPEDEPPPEELFFSDRQGGSTANAFVRNRAQIGFSFVPFPSLPALVCNTYYMVQHDWAESGWKPINVYGFECAYKF